MFEDMAKDTISVYKESGELVVSLVKASVQKNKVYLMNCKVLIEDGFIVERVMSNGGKEKYRILDAGFKESWGGHYQMTVEKVNPVKSTSGSGIHINVGDVGGHFTIGSGNMINSSSMPAELINLFQRLDAEVAGLKDFDKVEYEEILQELKGQLALQNQNKTVIKSLITGLQNALPSAESIVAITVGIASFFK